MFVINMCYAIRTEKQKNTHDIQTYKEIAAFAEGRRLDEIDKKRESGIRTYQTIFNVIGSGFITAVVVIAMYFLSS